MTASLGLALLAGVLTSLSPCMLPLLPVVLGAAASEHRLGPVALAAGLALSFVAVGLFVATIGFSVGLDGGVFGKLAAAILLGVGITLLAPRLQARFAIAAGPLSNWADARLRGLSAAGWRGQFSVGLLLGALWSPCVGPTLGAASVLAAKSENLGQVALTMALFGLGAALPLLALGVASRQAILRWRGRILGASGGFKTAFGLILVVTASAALLGFDKPLEAALVEASPQWLTELTTRF